MELVRTRFKKIKKEIVMNDDEVSMTKLNKILIASRSESQDDNLRISSAKIKPSQDLFKKLGPNCIPPRPRHRSPQMNQVCRFQINDSNLTSPPNDFQIMTNLR